MVNHHQHCFSGYEIYNNKYIFYGLGNFCFDNPVKRNSIWNEGYMLSLNFLTMERLISLLYHIYNVISCLRFVY